MTLVDLYARTVESFVDKVRAVAPDQWDLTTPCADWDVRHLVNHIVSEQRWSAPLFEGATIAEVGDAYDGDLLGEDPVASAAEGARATIGAVRAPGAVERTVHLSFGDTPGSEYLAQLFADHLVHGWDLAVATGADRTLDPDAVAACAEWFAGREELYRSAGAIGPRVDLPDGAGPQERFIAAWGRDPYR